MNYLRLQFCSSASPFSGSSAAVLTIKRANTNQWTFHRFVCNQLLWQPSNNCSSSSAFLFLQNSFSHTEALVLRPLLGRWDLFFVHQRQSFNKLDRAEPFKMSVCHLKNKQVKFVFLLFFKEQEEHPLVYRGSSAIGRSGGALKELAIQRATAQPQPLHQHRGAG